MNNRIDPRVLREVADLAAFVLQDRESEAPLPKDLDRAQLVAALPDKLPREGIAAERVIQILREVVIRGSLNLTNPMTFGLMTPPPLPMAAAIDMLISALNQNLGCAWRTAPAAIELELQTIRWFCDLFGLPEGSGGHFTNGGTVSNLTGVRLALQQQFPEVRNKGVSILQAVPIIYVSDQGHFSVDRAAGILGLGEQQVRKVPSRDDLRIDLAQLATQISQDRKAGLLPFLIVGTAGTTSNGTIDPLDDLATLAHDLDLWFHVDAAYGGALVLSDRLRDELRGIERADSVSFDPHKWMFIPFAVGMILSPHKQLFREAFTHETAYLGKKHILEQISAPSGFYEVSLDASRRFNGLKLWAALHHLGVSGFARIIEEQIDLAEYLYQRVGEISQMELAPRSPTNIVCCRFAPSGISDSVSNLWQPEFQRRLEESLECWLTTATIKGKTYLRFNLLHYNLQKEHIDQLLVAINSIAKEWVAPA